MHDDPDELLTPQQVAKWLQISTAALYRWAASGKIPSINIGGGDITGQSKLRFDRTAVQGWLDSRTTAVPVDPIPEAPKALSQALEG